MRIFSIIILMTLGLSGCSGFVAQEIRMYNREQIENLELGMNREQVLNTMGTETYATDVAINNPYKSELFQTEEGGITEVIYYYTDIKFDDNAVSDDELTPIVLREGEVVGWGWICLRQEVPGELLNSQSMVPISR